MLGLLCDVFTSQDIADMADNNKQVELEAGGTGEELDDIDLDDYIA